MRWQIRRNPHTARSSFWVVIAASSCGTVADLRRTPTHSLETERSDSPTRVRFARSVKLESALAVYAALAGDRISNYSRRNQPRAPVLISLHSPRLVDSVCLARSARRGPLCEPKWVQKFESGAP